MKSGWLAARIPKSVGRTSVCTKYVTSSPGEFRMSMHSIVPVGRHSTLSTTIVPNWATDRSLIRPVPVMAVPTTLPTTPRTRATSMAATPTTTDETVLATSTLLRFGTRVKVVRPVRWLHSRVIARIAMMGSTIVMGKPIAAAKVLWVSCSSGAKTIVPIVARTPTMTRLAINQNPDRAGRGPRT